MHATLRQPVLADAGTIADFHVATWRETYTHLLPTGYFSGAYVAARHRMWEQVLAHPQEDVVIRVAESDGSIVGFSWAGPSIAEGGAEPPRARQLYAIYLLQTHQGSGVGQALLDAALGSSPAMLWVAKENPRAVAFYRRNGFRLDGVEQIVPRTPAITDARMLR